MAIDIHFLSNPAILLLGIYPRERKIYVYKKVYRSIFIDLIHNILKVKTIHKNTNRRMHKHILIYLYNEITFRNKKKSLIHTTKWIFLKKYHVEQKKRDTKDSILNDFIYMKDKHRQNKCRMTEVREWLPFGWGKWDRKQMGEFSGLIEIQYILFLVVVAQTALTILK